MPRRSARSAPPIWAARLPRYRIYLVAFLVTGLPRFAVFAVETPLVAVLLVFVASGFAAGFINPVLGAVTFERIPGPLIGRVTSMSTAMAWSLMPLGGLLGGLLVDAWSLPGAMLVCGVGVPRGHDGAGVRPAVEGDERPPGAARACARRHRRRVSRGPARPGPSPHQHHWAGRS